MDARRGARVRPGNGELPLPRLAPDPRLGGRARADGLPAAVLRGGDRSLRTLSAVADPARSGPARPAQPAGLLVLGRRPVRALPGAGSVAGRGAPSGLAAQPRRAAATDWPAKMLIVLGLLSLAGWLITRERLLPRRPITTEEELAGHTAA